MVTGIGRNATLGITWGPPPSPITMAQAHQSHHRIQNSNVTKAQYGEVPLTFVIFLLPSSFSSPALSWEVSSCCLQLQGLEIKEGFSHKIDIHYIYILFLYYREGREEGVQVAGRWWRKGGDEMRRE